MSHQPVDPIQQAIDNYMEMEAKARAWDIILKDPELRAHEREALQRFLAQAKMELAKRD